MDMNNVKTPVARLSPREEPHSISLQIEDCWQRDYNEETKAAAESVQTKLLPESERVTLPLEIPRRTIKTFGRV